MIQSNVVPPILQLLLFKTGCKLHLKWLIIFEKSFTKYFQNLFANDYSNIEKVLFSNEMNILPSFTHFLQFSRICKISFTDLHTNIYATRGSILPSLRQNIVFDNVWSQNIINMAHITCLWVFYPFSRRMLWPIFRGESMIAAFRLAASGREPCGIDGI